MVRNIRRPGKKTNKRSIVAGKKRAIVPQKPRGFRAIPWMRNYEFLTGDVNWKDYGGIWYRSAGDHTYYVIEFINFENATGELMNGNKYAVVGASLDLELDGGWANEFDSALRMMGETRKSISGELQLLEAVYEYSGGNRVLELYGNNANKLLAEAKRRL